MAGASHDWAQINPKPAHRPLSLLANLVLRPSNIEASTLGRDAMAGAISGVVQIAYCISFAALIFTGDLAGGFPLGLSLIHI